MMRKFFGHPLHIADTSQMQGVISALKCETEFGNVTIKLRRSGGVVASYKMTAHSHIVVVMIE